MSGCPATQVARGRQRECVISPDGKQKAFYRARNFWVANVDGTGERQVTTDGDEKKRIKSGTGSWVYGEELGQTTAIWWSPDSSKVATYRFDESKVKDYYIQMDQTQVTGQVDIEAYPKSGADNPVPEVLLYDVAAKKITTIDVRDGKPFTNDVVGHYVYNVGWSPDGTELTMNRTNRRQQIMEFVACSPATTKCRVIVREESKTGWVDNRPQLRLLEDKKRFIWESERNGWTNYYLYDFSGKLIHPITRNYDLRVRRDRKSRRSGGRDVLHRARRRQPHEDAAAPGGPRRAQRRAAHGSEVHAHGERFAGQQVSRRRLSDARPAAGDAARSTPTGRCWRSSPRATSRSSTTLGLKKVEMFTYKAADGQTTLYGTIAFPSNFDPSKKYPTLVPVYGGPASGSNVPTENFATPNPSTEYGFLVVNVMSRAAPGMGRKTLDSIYMKLGQTEMDDMAEGVKALWSRPYFDKGRVGIHGSSYGGYTSAMQILKHPDVFTAASAGSPVTSWDHYDTIYTERYMWIPQENEAGYVGGQRDDLRQESQGPAADLLRHRRQQRAPEQRDAAHPRAAAGWEELRGAGGTRCGPQQRRQPAHDGVLHREPGAAAGPPHRADRREVALAARRLFAPVHHDGAVLHHPADAGEQRVDLLREDCPRPRRCRRDSRARGDRAGPRRRAFRAGSSSRSGVPAPASCPP